MMVGSLSHKTEFPPTGVVPDAETAKSIALAMALQIWGKEKVTSQLPLRAGLKGRFEWECTQHVSMGAKREG